MATGFDISNLSAYTEEIADRFFAEAVMTAPTLARLQPYPGIKGKTKLPYVFGNYDIIQDKSCSPTAKGQLGFKQRELDPRNLMVFEQFCNDDLLPYFLRKGMRPGSQVDGLEFADVLMPHLTNLMNKVMEIVAWQGEDGGSNAIASANLVDGFNTIIADAITAGDIPASQQKSTGTFTTSNIISALRALYKALPTDVYDDAISNPGWAIFCEPKVKMLYDEAYQNTYGNNNNYQNFSQKNMVGTSIELVSTTGLTGTNKVILANMNEMWYGFDTEGEDTAFDISQGTGSEKYQVFVDSTFKAAFQFAFAGNLVVDNF